MENKSERVMNMKEFDDLDDLDVFLDMDTFEKLSNKEKIIFLLSKVSELNRLLIEMHEYVNDAYDYFQ